MSRIAYCLLLLVLIGSINPIVAYEPHALLPNQHDHVAMWWAEGFPAHSADMPWHRCVQGGHYGFVLDTESMQFPHFGALSSDASSTNIPSAGDLSQLPPAEMQLQAIVDGKSYRCVAGGKWTKKTGPRLIESGRFLQRADVTNLMFQSIDGETLNVDARMETAAWSDRLGLILSARPGMQSIQAGKASFGRIGGGFGLDGTNDFEIPHETAIDTAKFTLCFWAWVPEDYRVADRSSPWLVCKNRNENRDGNFGIVILNGLAEARINIGGGKSNRFTARTSRRIKTGRWNYFTLTYDGSDLRLYIDAKLAAKQKIDRHRTAGMDSLVFGRRQDSSTDSHRLRSVIDEINYFDRALSGNEITRSFRDPASIPTKLKPVRHWGFKTDGVASKSIPREQWKSCELKIALQSGQKVVEERLAIPAIGDNLDPSYREVGLAIDPISLRKLSTTCDLGVIATESISRAKRSVTYDHAIGWHRINLDGIKPVIPDPAKEVVRLLETDSDSRNDAMERIRLRLSNPSDREQVARLMFEKTRGGFKDSIGSSITGVSAILRDVDGNPTGIPVQLSKNWHDDGSDDDYAGQWFHGISQVRLPPKSNVELELSMAYGHWGGVPAASTSQLCLIGWGSNQLWNQTAIGAWGESICFEPDQIQANCSITDVRPLMLKSKPRNEPWKWTINAGGGDFFRMFDRGGTRVPHTAMKTTFHRYGPCLTEVTNEGLLTKAIEHSESISVSRTDDVLRTTYQLKMQVNQATDFSRMVFFQVGADTYNFSREKKMAVGNDSGLLKEWTTHWGGDQYRTKPIECIGRGTWASLHDSVMRENRNKLESLANRGIVIRDWKARLGGKDASAWMAEHGVTRHGSDSSTLDVVPPPGLSRLEPGDFIHATIEHIVVPRDAKDYYGPNTDLQSALAKHANTWRMIHREASINRHTVTVLQGELQHQHPDVRIGVVEDEARLTFSGGVGYVPITFTGLTSSSGYTLTINGQELDQSVHGKDFWQTDYDAKAKRWSQTYNLPVGQQEFAKLRFRKSPDVSHARRLQH